MTDSTATLDRTHPIEHGAAQITDLLTDLRHVPAWGLDAETTRWLLTAIPAGKAMLAELEARLLAHGRSMEIEADSGATSTAVWWSNATRQTRSSAHRAAKLAAALATELHEPVRVAMAEGRLLVDQAEVIIHAVQELPDELDPDLVRDASSI